MRKHKRDETGGEGYAKPIPDILSQIKDSYTELRPAERRVADVVLADVTFSVDASNAEIAGSTSEASHSAYMNVTSALAGIAADAKSVIAAIDDNRVRLSMKFLLQGFGVAASCVGRAAPPECAQS